VTLSPEARIVLRQIRRHHPEHLHEVPKLPALAPLPGRQLWAAIDELIALGLIGEAADGRLVWASTHAGVVAR
jgi:hypothetical protein